MKFKGTLQAKPFAAMAVGRLGGRTDKKKVTG
jgi:hypothetical protein